MIPIIAVLTPPPPRNIKDDADGEGSGLKLDFLKKLTSPFTKIIIQVNKELISDIAKVSL